MDGWWHRLGDAALDRIVERAQASAPDLRTAQARLREARARRRQTDSALWPQLGTSATARRTDEHVDGLGDDHATLYDVGFDAAWEVDLFGGLRASARAADADVAATRASLRDVRVSLVAEAARNYVELRGLQARLGTARTNLGLQARTLQLVRWRRQAGLVGALDVELATTNAAQTRAQVALLRGSVTASRLALELLLGLQPGALAGELGTDTVQYEGESSAPATAPATAAVAAHASALPELPGDLLAATPAEVLRQRADVRLAEAQWRAEALRVGRAYADLFPSLNLSGSLFTQAASTGALGDAGTRTLVGNLTAPIFQGGRLRAALAAQTAVRDRFAIAYEKAVLSALSDVEGAFAALAAGRGRSDALTTAEASARRAEQLARDRYASGLVDFASVLDAQRTVLSVQDGMISARVDALSAWIRLYKALGGGYVGDERARADDDARALGLER